MYLWKFNSKLRMFKVKEWSWGRTVNVYRFSLGDDKNVQKLIRVTLSQLCECTSKKHCILYSKRANCMVTIVSYTHTYISCSVCSVLMSLLLGYTAVEAIAAVTNNNNKTAFFSIPLIFLGILQSEKNNTTDRWTVFSKKYSLMRGLGIFEGCGVLLSKCIL